MPNERSAAASNSSSPDSPIATAQTARTRRPCRLVATVTLDGLLDGRGRVAQLLAEAADHEQRVVDREREAEHRRDVQDVDRTAR